MSNENSEDISPLELEILLLFYTFSNQYGEVDMISCQKWARDNMGVHISSSPFTFDQVHLNVLMQNNLVPDISDLIKKLRLSKKE